MSSDLKDQIIGISDCRGSSFYLDKYIEVIKAGGIPLMLPPSDHEKSLEVYLNQCTPHKLWLNEKLKAIKTNLNNIPKDTTLFFSSGTTGNPKVIVHSNTSLKDSAFISLKEAHGLSSDVIITPLPLWHVGGLLNYYRSLYLNRPLELIKTSEFTKSLKKRKVFAVMVPAQLEKILEKNSNEDFENVTFYLGGQGISKKLIHKVIEKKIVAISGYGMTETAGAIAIKEVGIDSKMTIMKDSQVKINEADKRILIKNNRLVLGFIENNEYQSLLNKSDDFFRSSDFGELSHYSLNVLGRLDRVFITGGENIDPTMIENLILDNISSVNQVKLIPFPDQQLGNVSYLFIENLNQNILEQLKVILPHFFRPKKIYNWPIFKGLKPSLIDFHDVIEQDLES